MNKIKDKIINEFPTDITNLPVIQNYLANYPIQKLPEELTCGNHEVYTINTLNTDTNELGILFLFPGSGIQEHSHPKKNGISEIYTIIGQNKITWKGNSEPIQECQLDDSHGIEIDNTPRTVYYKKTNELLISKEKSQMKILTPQRTHKFLRRMWKLFKIS